MADLKKFLDQQGVSTLWTKVAEKVAAEAKAREDALKAEATARAAAIKSEADRLDLAIADVVDDLAALDAYVGDIPADYTESNIVAFIQKRAQEVLAAAQGGSNETAASVKAALEAYVAENDPKVSKNTGDIATIMSDYLKTADKTELANSISANADEITRIDNALKAAVENEGAGLDSIKELATWIEEHGEDAAGYAAAIDALEALVGNTAVATQIANAIAAENLAQFATDDDLAALAAKVDTGDKTVTAAINAAIDALKIGDYAKAADLTTLAGRVAVNEGLIADLQAADIALGARIKAVEDKVPTWDAAEQNAKDYADSLAGNYDAKGAAATAEANARAYVDSEINAKVIALTPAEVEAIISGAQA